ncbi:hypothetical protein CDEST_01117 [Colletotrichum destructivum]|uniref:Uncharacterized protein n=1 Tax=Colletotrichum destructivum TaxID=34406 RepID=A0AAX4HZB9_9PEZI|nr:hypothetical protein CDEST_01117 [Colletotrichum destructivum]
MASSYTLINNNPAGGTVRLLLLRSLFQALPGLETGLEADGSITQDTMYNHHQQARPPPPPTDQPNLTICRFIAQTPSQDKAWAALAADTKHYTQPVSSRTSLAYPAAAVQ